MCAVCWARCTGCAHRQSSSQHVSHLQRRMLTKTHAMPGAPEWAHGSAAIGSQDCLVSKPLPFHSPLWAPCPARPVYKPGSGNLQPAGQSGPLLTFINKVLLRQRHAHSFTYCLWLLSHYSSRVEKEILWPAKSEISNLWLFKKKILPTPDI